MSAFLAEDFARIGAGPIDRCMKIDGCRLYLSGATGFFGKNLLALFAFLHARGASFHVTALARSPARFLAEQAWCRDFAWLDWNAGDMRESWPGMAHYDYLLHAATDTAAAAHLDHLSLFDDILTGTRRALEFAVARGAGRLLLCGSGAQYGAIPASLSQGIPDTDPMACDPTLPASAYGEAKRASEMLAAIHGAKYGLQVVNTRCFAFVGPGLPLDGHFAIGNFLGNALDGRTIELTTGGHATRSYLYGADLAVWLLVLLLHAEPGRPINVGSDVPITVLNLARRVRDVVSPGAEVRVCDEAFSGERNFYLPSIARARGLGLDVWTDVDRAISRTARWHRSRQAATGREIPR